MTDAALDKKKHRPGELFQHSERYIPNNPKIIILQIPSGSS